MHFAIKSLLVCFCVYYNLILIFFNFWTKYISVTTVNTKQFNVFNSRSKENMNWTWTWTARKLVNFYLYYINIFVKKRTIVWSEYSVILGIVPKLHSKLSRSFLTRGYAKHRSELLRWGKITHSLTMMLAIGMSLQYLR